MNHFTFNKPFLGLFLAFWAVFFLSCHLEKLEDNLKAKFDVKNAMCEAPCDPGFLNQSENAQAYIWVFGDGKPNGADETPSHIYDLSGDYKAFLVAIGKDGRRDTSPIITIKIVAPGALGPRSCFRASIDTCYAPCTVKFTNCSSKANSYLWDFGDGSPLSMDKEPSYRYKFAGTYQVKLIVKDLSGSQKPDTAISIITIKPRTYKTSLTGQSFNGFITGVSVQDTSLTLLLEYSK